MFGYNITCCNVFWSRFFKVWEWLEEDGYVKGKDLRNYEKQIPEKYSYLEPSELETVYNCLVKVYNFKLSNKYARITLDNVLYADMGISMTFTDVYERTGQVFEVKTTECKYMKLDLEYLKKLLNK